MRPLRFAVLGAGHISQSAVLPAFARAGRGVALVGLLADGPRRRRLARHYRLEAAWSEDQLPEALASGVFDALYIATANHRHLDQALAALRAGIHVLLEKPLTPTVPAAERLRAEAARSGARLMGAYRLHCDPFYLAALERVRHGEIGEPRAFAAALSMQVRRGNVRTRAAAGGGSMLDLGLYCVNAARSLLEGEPLEVRAIAVAGHDARSSEVDETTCAVLRFPGDRLATITSSFGAASASWYEVLGSSGSLRLQNAFALSGTMELELRAGRRVERRQARVGDQFAAEIAYFAACIRQDRAPEPDAEEGLRDLRVIAAIRRAAAGRRAVVLPALPARAGPGRRLARYVPAARRPPLLIEVRNPSHDH
jgi:glucose-fructose oxidoreductase